MNRSSGLVFTLLIVIAFFFFQHRGTPMVPFPSAANTVGNTVRIDVSMTPPPATGESWGLSRTANGTYVTTVFNNGRIVRAYRTSGAGTPAPGGDGVNYPLTGDVNFDGVVYRGVLVHLNRGSKSGYVEFQQLPTASANSTANGTAANTAGDSGNAANAP